MLIPLTDKTDVRAIDTKELSEKEVEEELRMKEDKGIEERKDMADLKEKQLEKEKEEMSQREEGVEEQKQRLKEEEEELERQKREAEKIRDEEERKKRVEELAEKERQAEEEKERLLREEERLEEDRREVEKREEDVEEDRRSIERDEKIEKIKEEIEEDPDKVAEKLLEKEEELKKTAQKDPIAAGALYYLKVREILTDGHYANELYRIDAATGEFINKAPEFPHIAGHKYSVIPGEGVLVLTHGEGREAHRLTLLDLTTLKPLKMGEADIYHRSFIEKRGDFIYAIDFRGTNDFRLGKYDAATLELIAESDERVDKDTVFHMYGELVYINSWNKKMLILSAEDLSKMRVVDLP
jgi:hypothetical protein